MSGKDQKKLNGITEAALQRGLYQYGEQAVDPLFSEE